MCVVKISKGGECVAEQNMYEAECCEEHLIHNELLQKVDGKMPDEQEISDLSDLNMTQSAISHQLKVLKQSKLVTNRREGKSIFYSLADSHVRSIIAQGRDHIEEDIKK